jgi:hypothetical protein
MSYVPFIPFFPDKRWENITAYRKAAVTTTTLFWHVGFRRKPKENSTLILAASLSTQFF